MITIFCPGVVRIYAGGAGGLAVNKADRRQTGSWGHPCTCRVHILAQGQGRYFANTVLLVHLLEHKQHIGPAPIRSK